MLTKKQKRVRTRIIISLILYAALLILIKSGIGALEDRIWIHAGLYAVPYLVAGCDVIAKAVRNIAHGQVFDENFLMMLATFGAFAIQEYPEAAAVMIFYQIGELFQGYAVGRSRQSIADMMDIVPENANVESGGHLTETDPDDVEIGSIIVIKPGERVPLDGIVIEGESFLDTAALTGESVPRRVQAGDKILSGCVNAEGTLRVRTTKAFEDSTVARILEMTENAVDKKARTENFITRFAKYYTPAVTIAALIVAVVPPLILGGGWFDWIQRACVFLVISCPCALVISVPLGFFGGIGAASKLGILVKGSNFLEAMADATTIVFDKTGTLTRGEFAVTRIQPAMGADDDSPLSTGNNSGDIRKTPEIDAAAQKSGAADADASSAEAARRQLLELAAIGEAYSNHPIAASIQEAYGAEPDLSRICEVNETAGQGVSALLDGAVLLVGNAKLLQEHGIGCDGDGSEKTVVHVAWGGRYRGYLEISDTMKPEAAEAVRTMKNLGVKKTVMLTGDHESAARSIAAEAGIDEVYAELLPDQKVETVETLLEKQGKKERLAYVGDGINDAPVLSRADIGIAMGSMGSDAAIEAADIVLMDDNIARIASAVEISRRTLRIVRQNIVFALAVKAVVLALGAAGMANMWEAVFADVGVSVIATINAMRTLRTRSHT